MMTISVPARSSDLEGAEINQPGGPKSAVKSCEVPDAFPEPSIATQARREGRFEEDEAEKV